MQVHGADAPAGYGDVESLILRMTPEQQYQLNEAIMLAKKQTGFSAPRWQCIEIICQEWLGAFGKWQPDWPDNDAPSARPSVAKQLRVIAEAHQPLGARESPVELDARILRLLKGRRGFDVALGVVAQRLLAQRLTPLERLMSRCAWREFGCQCLEEYCRERLGISPRSFRERAWLERRMCALPPLRVALESGLLTYSKALLVAKDARLHDVDERIAEAAGTTWQKVERESTESERKRNLARGLNRIWGPEDAMRTVALAIASAQAVAEASGLGKIEAGQALALIATHFIRVWQEHKRRQPAPRRREVLLRHDGLCAVPGCSRPAHDAHHIRFRSRGGTDETWNLVGLCAPHHHQGVHGGGLTVSGRAGERLEWLFGDGERWVTEGEEVHRRSDQTA